jgi:hypothetical protein
MPKSKGWTRGFDWGDFIGKDDVQAYKLVVDGDSEIQGCIALTNEGDFAIVDLIEKSPVNRKPHEQFSNVTGVMFAYASKIIVDQGGLGYLCFEPKTGLATHYERTYNAKFHNPRLNLMTILEVDARRLIGLYYR